MDRRTLLKTGVATTAGGLLIPAADGLTASAEAAPRVGEVLAHGLSTPWGIAFLPNGDALPAKATRGGSTGCARAAVAGWSDGSTSPARRRTGARAACSGWPYASTGDAENRALAQDRGSLAGKILRLTPDGRVPRGRAFIGALRGRSL